MKIINLTQHLATPEQKKQGVVDCHPEKRQKLIDLLTFDVIPNKGIIEQRAQQLVAMVKETVPEGTAVMIGGAPFLMSFLEQVLAGERYRPVYAFTRRETVEETLPDGKVIKKSSFVHEGFVNVL